MLCLNIYLSSTAFYGVCRQVVKTSDCDSDMRGFESHHAPQVKLNGLCQKLIDDGPNCWGSIIDPVPLTGREPRGLLVTVEVMLVEGRERSLFIVFCTFKHNAVGC